ncbi:hypothetical protein [Actinokineospora bangkokensis]|uniref:hypothetical protein n=1 Tax=Actinokineospora bangkokensis TaxID=1193682 RepID=UPI0038BB90E4
MTVRVPRRGAADPRCSWSVATPVVAAVAADAAAGVAGVARLETGVVGLIGSAVHQTRQRLAGTTPADVDGVRVRVEPGAAGAPVNPADPADPEDAVGAGDAEDREDVVDVEVDIALDGFDQAAAVTSAVRRAVRDRVAAATGIRLRSVCVTVLDVSVDDAVAGGRA